MESKNLILVDDRGNAYTLKPYPIHKTMPVYEYNKVTGSFEWMIAHNAQICGQMADGAKTWKFDEMDEDGIYLASRHNGKLVLWRE